MTSANYAVKTFSELLCSCWPTVMKAKESGVMESFKVDWLQANWELVVEGLLCSYPQSLEVYGEGADCNGASSRVLYPEILPTHKIVCLLTPNEVYDHISQKRIPCSELSIVEFDRLVSLDGRGWYSESPPFDKVLGFVEDERVVVGLNEVVVDCIEI